MTEAVFYKHVVLIDPDRDSRRNSRFLLQLSNLQVTSFEYLDEALNWLLCLGRPDGIDLVAVKNLTDSVESRFFIATICRLVPVLMVTSRREELQGLVDCLKADEALSLDWCLKEEFHHRLLPANGKLPASQL